MQVAPSEVAIETVSLTKTYGKSSTPAVAGIELGDSPRHDLYAPRKKWCGQDYFLAHGCDPAQAHLGEHQGARL